MSGLGIVLAGITFASWAEVFFAVLMLVPLLFFTACVAYLLLLLLNALPLRRRVILLDRPDLRSGLRPSLHSDLAEAAQGLSDKNPSSNSKGNFGTSPDAIDAAHAARFVLLIPAHNEELLLGSALEALQQVDYPRDRYEIVVIADNCTDNTASIARDAGAMAMERSDSARIGKGYALEDALQWLMAANGSAEVRAGSLHMSTGGDALSASVWERARQFDAVVILDADTFVSSNMLSAFCHALNRGEKVVQVRYDVFNTDDSWRTRLMSCALALAHVVKPLGRERLRLSDGLKGNGMCFAREVVVNVGWSGESITEDIEYTFRVCRAGYRVAFVPEACVWAQMPVTGAQAASQRQRWEGGRYRLLFKVAPSLMLESVRTGNRLLRDRAIELIVPPFAEMFALPLALGVVCALAAVVLGWRSALLLTVAWGLILVLQGTYLLAGMWVARMSGRVVVSLLFAPFYIAWKLGLYVVMAVGRSAGGWKRTERHELTK